MLINYAMQGICKYVYILFVHYAYHLEYNWCGVDIAVAVAIMV
jgi:hypothetical protein